jgi:hypothetical protein
MQRAGGLFVISGILFGHCFLSWRQKHRNSQPAAHAQRRRLQSQAAITGNETARFAQKRCFSLLNLLVPLRQCGQPGGPLTT